MVSRFLASRLCSKVPVKAKAHVSREAGDGGQSIRGGGVGGAPPPRTGFAPATYPTMPHSATRNPFYLPHWRHLVTLRTGKPCKLTGSGGVGVRRRRRNGLCRRAACTRSCAARAVRGTLWEEFRRGRRVPAVSARRTRGAAPRRAGAARRA